MLPGTYSAIGSLTILLFVLLILVASIRWYLLLKNISFVKEHAEILSDGSGEITFKSLLKVFLNSKILFLLLGMLITLLLIQIFISFGNAQKGCVLLPNPHARSVPSKIFRDYNHNIHSSIEENQIFYSEPMYDACSGIVTSLVLEGKIHKNGTIIDTIDFTLLQERNLTTFYINGTHRWDTLSRPNQVKKHILFIDVIQKNSNPFEIMLAVLKKFYCRKTTESTDQIEIKYPVYDTPKELTSGSLLLVSVADPITNADRWKMINRAADGVAPVFGNPGIRPVPVEHCTLTPPRICDMIVF